MNGINLKIFCLILLLLYSCFGEKKQKNSLNISNSAENIVVNARFLNIYKHDGYRVMEVVDPWDMSKLLRRYILVNKSDTLPLDLPDGELVRTPVERIIAYTSVDIGSLKSLNSLEKVVGVCESKYIISPYIQKSLKNGDVKDLGSYTKPHIEQLLSTNADIIITSPHKGDDYGLVEKLNIPIAECASYMESTPLGRSEWIKFYAQFINKEELADSIYKSVELKYKEVAKYIAENISDRPTILADKRYGQVWYAASGSSYAASLYKDAGASYPWSESVETGSIPLSFEKVFQTAHDAKVWIFTYFKPEGNLTLNELKEEYDSYSAFSAFKNKRVYGCNSKSVPVYEESPLRPDLLLQDLAKMLHPEYFEEYNFTYYKKLK